MEWISAKNPKWIDEKQSAVCLTVVFAGIANPISFIAKADDTARHGRELFDKAVAGDFGDIAKYVSEPVWYDPEVIRQNIKLEYAQHRTTQIAKAYGKSISDFRDEELKHTRLLTLSSLILADPEQYAGSLFNGTKLPTDPSEIKQVVSDYLSHWAQIAQAVETAVADYKKSVAAIDAVSQQHLIENYPYKA